MKKHQPPIAPPKRSEDDSAARQRRRERLLDEALEETFPASDPIAVYMPDDHWRREHAPVPGRENPRLQPHRRG